MISTDRSGEVGVRTTEQVKLSVEHADVAVMCLRLDATINRAMLGMNMPAETNWD